MLMEYNFTLRLKIILSAIGGCVPEYKNALEESLGEGALSKFETIAAQNMKDMNNLATILYKNFFRYLK